MKSHILLGITLFVLCLFSLSNGYAASQIPHEVGGIALGSDVTDYPNIEYSNYMKEVVVYDWNGFDKGIISYGICKFPGEIIKIKLKYHESDKGYFKTLLKKFRKKYGKPDEWKGDSFGILHIWKWNFVDKNNNRVNLVLQHNSKNPNENIGNMVKLYYPDRIVAEQRCFTEQCSSHRKKSTTGKEDNWDFLIPK